jgi:hypothetical protein
LKLDLEFARDDARDVQQIFDQFRLRFGVPLNDLNGTNLFLVAQLIRIQQTCPSEYGRQRRAKFVRHRREKLVFDPVRVFKFLRPHA